MDLTVYAKAGVVELDEELLKMEEERINNNIKKAREYKAEVDAMHRKIDLFYSGRYLDAIKANEAWREIPSYNILANIHSVMYNNQSNRKFDCSLKPALGNPEIAAVVNFLNNLTRRTWEYIDMETVVNNSIYDACEFGTAITYVGIANETLPLICENGSIGRSIRALNIPPTQFITNESANSIKEAAFCCTMSATSVANAYMMFNNPEEIERLKAVFGHTNMTEDELKRALLYDNANAYSSQADAEEFGQVLERNYDDMKGQVLYQCYYELVGPERQLMITYIIEKKIIRRVVMPNMNRFPFVAQYERKANGSFWGVSSMHDVIGIQKSITKLDSIMATYAVKADKPLTIINTAAGIPLADVFTKLKTPDAILEINSDNINNAIAHVTPPEIPVTVMGFRETLVASAYEMVNVNDFTRGNNAVSGTKTGAMEIQNANATATDSIRLENLRQYQRELYELFVYQIKNILIETNLKRLKTGAIADDSFLADSAGIMLQNIQQVDFSEFDKQLLMEIDRAMKIEVKQKTVRTPEQERQVVMELIKFQAQAADQLPVPLITAQEAIEILDLPNKDEILSRIRQATFERAQVNQQEGINAVANVLLSGLSRQKGTLAMSALTSGNLNKAFNAGMNGAKPGGKKPGGKKPAPKGR